MDEPRLPVSNDRSFLLAEVLSPWSSRSNCVQRPRFRSQADFALRRNASTHNRLFTNQPFNLVGPLSFDPRVKLHWSISLTAYKCLAAVHCVIVFQPCTLLLMVEISRRRASSVCIFQLHILKCYEVHLLSAFWFISWKNSLNTIHHWWRSCYYCFIFNAPRLMLECLTTRAITRWLVELIDLINLIYSHLKALEIFLSCLSSIMHTAIQV